MWTRSVSALIGWCQVESGESSSSFAQDVVYRASNVATDSRDRPLQPVRILDCGTLQLTEPFVVEKAGAEL